VNVLLTSVGRRSYLVHYFQKALKGKGVVVAGNSCANTPGMYIADYSELVPHSHARNYIDEIVAICRKYDIGLLCSCHDIDVYILAKHEQTLRQAGVIPVLPSADWGWGCLDKWECGKRLQAAGLSVPWSSLSLAETKTALSRGEIALPMIVKPRLGFGSLSVNRCGTLSQLENFVGITADRFREMQIPVFSDISPAESVLIQQELSGPDLRLNLVNDLDGNYSGHMICQVHAMRAGESDSATTLDGDVLGDLPYRLSSLIKHTGILGIDLMMNNGLYSIIDINPRFTGEYPFFHLAGANIPASLCAWAEGNTPDPQWLVPGVGVHCYKDIAPKKLNAT
jgi:carbamoyl-phosphate synthase large subunit